MEDREMTPPTPTLTSLMAMAKKEDWDGVDAAIGAVANEPESLVWAETGLDDEDGNLRDLAASLFERSSAGLTPTVTELLLRHVAHDDNPYASFRSAFALYRAGNRSPEVVKKLQEARDDEDVAGIAEKYLSQQ